MLELQAAKLRYCGYVSGLLVYSKTCLKQSLKIDKTKFLMENGLLMEVEGIAECSAIFLTCIKR